VPSPPAEQKKEDWSRTQDDAKKIGILNMSEVYKLTHNPDGSPTLLKKDTDVSKLKTQDFERIHKELLDFSHNSFQKEKRQNIKWGGGALEHAGDKLHTGNARLPVVFNEMLTKSGHDFKQAVANKSR